ncbi:hypothetical protein L3Q82_017909 [Scortum barcoo]|uniref:Uncharacterized protein n=1 Tax=Scortum barcoo TaxID=214431 RepID=A0ACB8VJC4_9TELE|nr:hypothetical protein L3Q82_017909 [Scortum barcoo]
MSFLHRVAGRSLRDRVRSSVTREELGVEPLLLCIERSQLRWLWGICFGCPLDASPREVFQACPTGRRPRRKDPGHAGETMCLSAGWPGNASGSVPGRAGGSVWGEGSLGISAQTAASATRSRIKRLKMDGWMPICNRPFISITDDLCNICSGTTGGTLNQELIETVYYNVLVLM